MQMKWGSCLVGLFCLFGGGGVSSVVNGDGEERV